MQCCRKQTDPLGDAPWMSGAAALGTDSAGDGVMLHLHVIVHAGHLQRRARQTKLNIWIDKVLELRT